MAEEDFTASSLDDAKLLSAYQKTRKSLIERLGNWEDQKSWDEFYRTYWRLIYSVALKAGLRSEEAFDAVQEVIVVVAKQTQKGQYDPKQGSFKSWLMQQTRWRINDQFRRRAKDTAMRKDMDDERSTATMDQFEDTEGNHLERVWDIEWKKHIVDKAIARVKSQVTPKQFQIFDCYVVKDWGVRKTMNELGVSVAQVYLAKHRVGGLLKQEITSIENSLR